MTKRAALPLLAAMAMSFSAHGLAADENGFYDRKAEGWFFYNEPQEVAKEPPPPPPEPEAPKTASKVTPPPPHPTSPSPAAAQAGPAPLSAAWFRENLDKYRDAAWDNPTVANLRTYQYLQRYMMDRSEEFADNWEVAMQGDAWLDATSTRPLASFAADDLDSQALKQRKATLGTISERAGLFFFYRSDCQQCATQAPVVQMLQRDFHLTPISVDGEHLPGIPFPEMRADSCHAERLGVQNLPALFLVTPDGNFSPIAQGAIAFNEAQGRITIAALRQGIISQEEYNATQPVANSKSLAQRLRLEDMQSLTANQEDGFIPPEKLLPYLESTTQGGLQ